MNNNLNGKKILVITTGSIAAVKIPLLVSNLIKTGAEVRCVVSPSASKLVSPLSLSTLSRNACYQDEDQWNRREPRPLHISLSEWADLIAVAPLSASSLSRWVHGLSEGLAASILLASEKPVIAAAAMNTAMWNNSSIKNNWETLKNFPNVIPLTPAEGLLACDRIGDGRMADPLLIQLAIESAIIQFRANSALHKDWSNLKLLVTAGPTIEDIDRARYLTNRSTGKMGVLIGQAARFRGATVDLIHGPIQVEAALLEGLQTFAVRNSNEMYSILEDLQSSADAIAMTAAIADLKPLVNTKNIKLSKEELFKSMKDRFEIVPDLLSKLIANRKNNQVFLGFTALTGNDEKIKELAMLKKKQKKCDLLMANPIDRSNQGFESDSNGGWLLGPEEAINEIKIGSKLSVAHQLLDELKSVLINKLKNK
ncbi:Phosphopantothenoylcysteine decarboxylase [Prochlorococcus marinus str. SS2]|uniref:bifunctional phosphopantothenoylcysteine decarboxylase/phosphopantothenate--cysteine ligase CoaBC n=1 Tax=Prochlorococcus sp. SS52 TaxID=1499501 RepID=UPI0003077A76|nr:Phosphopantothenoylcysteine decarboxylase [Prochlorococcus marinus str. SS2]KGG22893.1 Phosphopantothenoylcysteine decarboxylase [Prochlorococcus marinus str. SS35]